ncbi:sensor histidine kinase [soil metagenome]
MVLGEATTNATLIFSRGSAAFSTDDRPPMTGWSSKSLPAIDFLPNHRPTDRAMRTVWVRLSFDRSASARGAIALFGGSLNSAFTLYLNGRPIYRSDINADSQQFGWYRPLYVPLQEPLLRPGVNVLMFRGTPKFGIGTLELGPDAVIHPLYYRDYYFSVVAPQVINGIIAILTAAFLLLWFGRPKENIFGWIALVGALWWFRNWHHYIAAWPWNTNLFWSMTIDSVFALVAATHAFAATFLNIVNRRRIIVITVAICFLGAIARHWLVAHNYSDMPSYAIFFPLILATVYLFMRHCWRQPNISNFAMLLAVTAANSFGFHDLGKIKLLWQGAPFFLMPFGGLLVFSAFSYALGQRVLQAFSAVEDINKTLEIRVAEASESLSRSEHERAQLQVALALDGERTRLMREIHDGIGSSLVAALASARRRNETPETIGTLTRSLTDLRIGVDSLEPVNGDVVVLLANLRHRMERELKGAGVAFVWKVKPTPPLDWLDPVGALHILRILQEAIGNVLGHAEAAFVEVRCDLSTREGADGVLIEIVDDGIGFDPDERTYGKGLANMVSRADAISARFAARSIAGDGTTVSLWLPLDRPWPGSREQR